MKIALALIVKGSDSEAEVLSRCLSHTAPFVDKIFITSTYKQGEPINQKVNEVAKLFDANISYFEWVNNFAKARNFNFEQVPKEYDYILWCDADDIFQGTEKIKKVVEDNPEVDAFIMDYLYEFDEYKVPVVVHKKTQIIRNDGTFYWDESAYLHEDLTCKREVTNKLIKGIERIHLSNGERFNVAKERNVEVAEIQVKELPNDPRSYWNLGNSYKGMGREEDSIGAFRTFISKSNSDEEKYIAYNAIADSLMNLGRSNEAIDAARYSIGIRPEYPDAYHILGTIFMNIGMLQEAERCFLFGLTRKPHYDKILVYNPREYDYIPMSKLAQVYFSLNKPQMAVPLLEGCLKIYPKNQKLKGLLRSIKKEAKKADELVEKISKLRKIKDDDKLKKELDKLPDEFKQHPLVCNLRNTRFIKTESSGKDLVYYCGFTEDVWTPETAKTKGIGGSEEAVIWISKLLAKMGWNVTVYNNCGHTEQEFDGVKYKPYWAWNYRNKEDVTILWRGNLRFADKGINSTKIFVDLHDVTNEGEFTPSILSKIDKIFIKSQAHRVLMPNIPDEKFVIVPNGIDDVFNQGIERDPMLLINTSSPDRSLGTLLDLFSEVKKQVPEAKLKWAYGWKVFDVVNSNNKEPMMWKKLITDKMQELGVVDLGRIGHTQIAKLYQEASILAYPSEFYEIDMISLSKAQASGAIPVTTDFAAMGGKQDVGGIFLHSKKGLDDWCLPGQFDFGTKDEELNKQWIDEVVKLLKNPPSEEERKEMRNKAMERFSWNKVVEVWNNNLK